MQFLFYFPRFFELCKDNENFKKNALIENRTTQIRTKQGLTVLHVHTRDKVLTNV